MSPININISNKTFKISACRICLDSKCVDAVLLDENNGWLELFEYCFGFSLIAQDQPRSVCKQCADNIKSYAKLKQQYQKSHDIWKSVASYVKYYTEKYNIDNKNEDNKNQCLNNPVSERIKINDESFDLIFDSDSNFHNDDGAFHFICTDIKVEKIEEYMQSESSDGNDISIDDEKLDIKVCSDSNEVDSKEENSEDIDPKFLNGNIKTKVKEAYTCKMCKKKYGIKKCYLKHINVCKSSKLTSKISTGNQTYAYDCGRAYGCENVASDNKDVANIKNKFQNIKFIENETNVHKNQDNSLFFCGLCKLSYTTNSDVNKHLGEHWSNNDLSCKLCDFVGVDLAAIASHRYFHYPLRHNNRFVCHICDVTKLSLLALHFHYRLVHLKKVGGFCSRCNKEFTKLRGWKKHERRHGPGYICDICGKRYAYKFLIKNHMVNHTSPSMYICDTCGMVFNQSRYLNRHINTVHENTGPVKCTHCNRMFKSAHTLSVHQRRLARKKRVKCEVCFKEYISPSFLKAHMVMHSEERPHCCDICGSRYKAKGQLKVHMRNHTGYLPFKCELCSKPFATSKQLKVHSSVHTGVRAYSCMHCNRTFHSRKLMVTHCALRHKNEIKEEEVKEK